MTSHFCFLRNGYTETLNELKSPVGCRLMFLLMDVHVNVFGTLDTVLPTLADVSAVYNIYKRVQTTTGAFEESKKFKLVNRLPFPLVFSLKLC